MRRQDREITDSAQIAAIIQQAQVCHLGLVDGDRPYVVPVSFGYSDGCVYIHSASEGYKLDLLRRNPTVCVEFETDVQLLQADKPCAWGLRYRSVIGWGVASLVDDPAAKSRALNAIMAHYGGNGDYVYSAAALAETAIIQVQIAAMTGKQAGYPRSVGNEESQASE